MVEKIKILYIDDEENNLVGFKASFRMEYHVLIASNTQDALAHLQNHPDIRIIFCDQRMPDKTGVEFFEEIRTAFPLPIRVLLTGYTDIEAVIDSINRGHIFRYVKKPWSNADVRSAIYEANNFYTTHSLLSVKNAELQKAYEELDKFAYSVSHDIRGPLSGILGAINSVRYLNSLEEMKEMLGLMEKSVRQLDTFILSVHDYYNLQRGELKISEINLADLSRDLDEIYKIYADTHEIRFNVNVSQSETFRNDEMSVKLILNNLLSNAFKYQKKDPDTPRKVDLSIEVEKGVATVTVRDNGIGIAEKHIDQIFNLFYRATVQEAGSGFGLYNVKDALLKLNGQIWVDSKEGEGTIFKVTIPGK